LSKSGAAGSFGGLTRVASAAPSKAELVELLKGVDDRQRNQGDWRSNAYIEQKEKDKVAVVFGLANKRSIELGLTQIQDPGGSYGDVALYKKLYGEGKLKLRIYKAVYGPGPEAQRLLRRNPASAGHVHSCPASGFEYPWPLAKQMAGVVSLLSVGKLHLNQGD